MAVVVVDRPKKEMIPGIGIRKSESNLLLSGNSLASVESLSLPLVQDVVLSADIGCAECQKRVADIMSRMNEIQSVVVSLLEKKVTLTCRYASVGKASTQQIATIYRKPLGKVAMIKRIFRSSR
ncbi:uncharacterized protein LOC121242913 isoform X1 [Juglans microcarpa x Juglans regia]|uniref:uncharacterized protein LOC121242913 isoform X1 n=1 Tax=Juglans microcarpa x Juglans regia TaxID=2249226 RepID=UPI001B7F1D63|nr:uncharacterized protein LOC121242913 isoform X1 [Juglans microcarpa x Juglans regia]